MLRPRSNFAVSILFGGALSLWACTSGQSLRDGNSPGTGGGMAGSGGTSLAGGTGGSGGKGGSGGVVGSGGTSGHGGTGGTSGHGGTGGVTYTDYMCNWTASASPCGVTTAVGGTGVGGTQGTGGTTGRDAAVEHGPVDALRSDATPDRVSTETSTVVIDSARVDSDGIDADGILRGYQVYGNELMAFEPCGSSELIWMDLSGGEKGLDLIPAQSCPGDASLGMCVRHMYTELLGVISPEGKYGHLSKYSRELRVQEFLVVNLADSSTCPFLPRAFPN